MSWDCLCAPCNDSGGVEVTSMQPTMGGDEYYIPPEDSQRTQGASRKATMCADALTGEAASPAPTPQGASGRPSLAKRPMVWEFDAQVIKGSESMGLDIMMAKDRQGVIINRVKPGAVQSLNSGAGVDVIKRGDRIVEVDGIGLGGSGDATEITNALKHASAIVSLKLVRLLEFKVANLPSSSCGLRFAEGPSGELMLAGLEDATNKTLQPDVELREGDYILKVNGKSGTPLELKALIDASDAITLRMRRGVADDPTSNVEV